MSRRTPAPLLLPLLVLACAACVPDESSGSRHAPGGASRTHDASRSDGLDGHAQHSPAIGAGDHGAHAHDGPAHVAVRTRQTRAQLIHDRDAGTFTVELHPIPLPPGGNGAHAMPVTPLLSVAMPFAATVTRFEVELIDGTGRPVPQHVLHHVNVMLPARRDLFRPIMQRFVAAGEETRPIELPWPLGIPLDEGEELVTYAMLHNGGATDYGDTTLRLHFRYTRAFGRIAVQPLFIDASPPPGPASWDLPPGRSMRQWQGRPAVSGRILGLGGHLHRYGTELILEDVTTGRVLFRTRPQIDADGTVVGVPRRHFLARLGLRIRSDHTYRITAVYDNPTGRTIPDGAMGAIGGVIRVRRNDWPAADPADSLYLQDLRILRGAAPPHAHD